MLDVDTNHATQTTETIDAAADEEEVKGEDCSAVNTVVLLFAVKAEGYGRWGKGKERPKRDQHLRL